MSDFSTDAGVKLPQTSYQKQYSRNTDQITPLLGVDHDIAELAKLLEDNAERQAGLAKRPVTPDVER